MTDNRSAHRLGAALLLAARLAAQGQAALVLDINTTPVVSSSSPAGFKALGGQVLFQARTNNLGTNLWRTDGTAAGTSLVSAAVESPFGFTPLGGILCFLTNNAVWRTDGTGAGTVQLAALVSPGNQEHPLQAVNGRVLFAASPGGLGHELCSTDGTAAGTGLVLDIAPGSPGSLPQGLVVSGTLCFFSADDGVHGRELWVTDGSAAGTHLVLDIAPGASASIAYNAFTGIPSPTGVFFVANDGTTGSELWHSDGTAAGTRLVADLAPGSAGAITDLRGAWTGTTLLFAASRADTGDELWRTDGSSAGTTLVADLVPGNGSSAPRDLLWTGAALWFSAANAAAGRELWRSDGTAAGTRLVADLQPGGQGSNPGPFAWTGSVLLFPATTTATGTELWTSDGTAAGTQLVRDMAPGATSGVYGTPVWTNGMLLFAGDDTVHGIEPWRSDGTAAGTNLLSDLAQQAGSSDPRGLVDALGTLFFAAYDPVAGTEVWRSDGSAAGTRLVRDIVPGNYGLTDPTLFALGAGVLFSANDASHGEEPWRSDGTTAGTGQVADVLPGAFGSAPAEWVRFGDRVAFTAAPLYFYSRSLWTTDGASVRAITSANLATTVSSPIAIGRTLYFLLGGAGFSQLWKSDGVSTGLVSTLAARNLIEYQGRLHFFATDAGGAALWRTDGTIAGTQPIRYVAGQTPVQAGALLFFSGFDAATGWELWRSDGTTAGTVLVKDIWPGPNSATVSGLRAWNDVLYFTADDGAHGRELWRSDGTAAGTWLVQDIRPGSAGALGFDPFLVMLPAARTFLFAADDGQHGIEPWRSDGTGAGTTLHQDLYPGPGHSRPHDAAASGGSLFFAAEDAARGVELWAMAAMAHAVPFGVGCEGTGGRVPRIGSSGGAPVLGNAAFTVTMADALPNGFAALALGQPADIHVGNGCHVNFAPLLLTVFLPTDAGGRAQVPLPIPNDASLRGLVAACQFGVADPAGAFRSMLAFSRGLRIVVSDS